MTKPDLPAIFRHMTDVEGNRISMMHGIVVDEAGKLTMLAFGDLSPNQIWDVMLQQIGMFDTVEAFWGLDRFAKPGQGVDTASLVTLYHWRRVGHEPGVGSSYGYRFGVIPYDEAGLRDTVWDHPFWSPLQEREVQHVLDQTTRSTARNLENQGVPGELTQALQDLLARAPRPLTNEAALALVENFITENRRTH